jgi:hypothetical protein
MSSLIKFFKKKIQNPLKKCVQENPSSSFEASPTAAASRSKVTKTKSSTFKRKLKLKLKNSFSRSDFNLTAEDNTLAAVA